MRVVFLAALVGCANPPLASPKVSSFGCSGPTELAAAAPTIPMGRVEVTKLGEGPDGPRLRVVAENASAAVLAARIGEALGVLTRVDHDLDTLPVTLYTPDMTLDLLSAVVRSSKIKISRPDWTRDHVLVFQKASTYGDTPDPAPMESKLLPPARRLSPEQVAGLYCRSVASPHGWAQVVGDRVMISDKRSTIDRFSEMLERVEQQLPVR